MQVVHDRGMPLEVEAEEVTRAHPAEINVAIVVVIDVLSPIGGVVYRRKVVRVVDLIAIIPVGVAVASIGIGGWIDRDDHVPANSVDQWTVLDGKPISQFYQHLRRSGFGTVQPSQDDVHRLGLGDDLARLRLADSTRVGQLRQVLPVTVDVAYIFFGRNEDNDGFAPFLGLTRGDYFHARGFVSQHPVVFQNVSVVVQHAWGANVVYQHVARRWNRRGGRQVIH